MSFREFLGSGCRVLLHGLYQDSVRVLLGVAFRIVFLGVWGSELMVSGSWVQALPCYIGP